eukprot:1175530-Alexandrium_andersonii.AAC.1
MAGLWRAKRKDCADYGFEDRGLKCAHACFPAFEPPQAPCSLAAPNGAESTSRELRGSISRPS